MQISKIVLVAISAAFGLGALSGCESTRMSETQEHQTVLPPAKKTSVKKSSALHLHTIYFDFDRYNIRPNQTAMADKMAQSLVDNPNARIQIQGHTDDRGSVEYNMALGTKRADALKTYLVTYGVNPNNIDTVSYGKERPVVQGSDETAWQQNRRDEVVALGE